VAGSAAPCFSPGTLLPEDGSPTGSGLLQLVREAAAKAQRKVPIKAVVVGLQGDELREEWI